jgi:16S rRNA (cytosine967-C5)-methyltransferase
MIQARAIAAQLLNRLQERRHTLDQLLDQADGQILRLNRSDRSLVHALVFGVQRWQSRLDWIIDHLVVRSRKIDPQVRTILRLGLFQLRFLQRIPASAAVHTSVELAKKSGRKWAAGFVNGVLREAIRQAEHIAWPDPEKNPLDHLAVTHAFPQWLISRWWHRWGAETTDALCRTINTIPDTSLRTNTLRISRRELMAKIRPEAESVWETHYSPEGIRLSRLLRPLAQWPAFQEGLFQVQGEAAQITSLFLGPRPGETVWDVCAGLGTKTAHMAQLMQNQGRIVATDLYANKLEKLDREMHRLGITIVQNMPMDLTSSDPAPPSPLPEFDRILLDAPCTGLGVLQKNPDGKWRLTARDIERNSARQLTLLTRAAPHLKTGGILVYVVCSLEPEENEQVVDTFLQKHPEFAIHPGSLGDIEDLNSLLTPRGFLSTIPHLSKMDGFFAAALIKG